MQKKTYCHFCGSQLVRKFFKGTDRLFCEQCKEIIYENPIPATCIVAVDSKDRMVLVKRSVEPKKGFWCLPGGFIELGETPEQAALRELKEETGLSGRINMLLGVTSSSNVQYQTVLVVGYLVTSYSGILRAGDDASDVACFRTDELPEIAFDSHLKFIRTYHAIYIG